MATVSVCNIVGCGKPVRVKSQGLCNLHYLRSRKYDGDPQGGGTLRGEPERFFREVILLHAGNECLIWPFARNEHGYARMFAASGETTLVHRRACEVVNGQPPTAEHQAAHSCGRGHEGCVSPKHQRWATPIENMADMRGHGTATVKARGDAHPRARLTADDVTAIRASRGKRTTPEVAANYGVKPETIKAIYSRRTWAWLN